MYWYRHRDRRVLSEIYLREPRISISTIGYPSHAKDLTATNLPDTAGFGYGSMSKPLRDALPPGFNTISGRTEDLCNPLLFQPGTDWEYGISFDWLGIVIERLTDTRLNDYFQQHIFTPLGMVNCTMFPNSQQQSQLATLNRRDPSTHCVSAIEHPLKHQFVDTTAQCLGGTGIFAPPAEYVKLLATLLNEGTCPITTSQILNPQSVTQMMDIPIPLFNKITPRGVFEGAKHVTNLIPEFSLPGSEGQLKNWAFGGAMEQTSGGWGLPIVWWAGLANCYWWCDRERGVGGIVAAQMLPFWDASVREVLAKVLGMIREEDCNRQW